MTEGLALVPLALAGDKRGSELESPMAIVILGGLITATFLNLVVVPALFMKWGRSSDSTAADRQNGVASRTISGQYTSLRARPFAFFGSIFPGPASRGEPERPADRAPVQPCKRAWRRPVLLS